MKRRTAAALAAGALVAIAWRSRRRYGAGRPVAQTSRSARNLQLARIGLGVGSTYVTASARKLFASAERRVEIDAQRRLHTAEQVAALKAYLAGLDANTRVLFVTHGIVINALTGISPASGEMVIVRLDASGNPIVAGRLLVDGGEVPIHRDEPGANLVERIVGQSLAQPL